MSSKNRTNTKKDNMKKINFITSPIKTRSRTLKERTVKVNSNATSSNKRDDAIHNVKGGGFILINKNDRAKLFEF